MEEQEVQINHKNTHHIIYSLHLVWFGLQTDIVFQIWLFLKQFSNTVFYFNTWTGAHSNSGVRAQNDKKSSVCPSKHNSISKVQELIYFVMLYIFKFQLF